MLRKLFVAVIGTAALFGLGAIAVSIHVPDSYEVKHPVPTQANTVQRANKTDLDLNDMPTAIVYLWEDERAAEEGSLPAHRAHELATQIYPDANPEVFIKGIDVEAYAIALGQWVDEYHQELSPVERGKAVARLEAAIQ